MSESNLSFYEKLNLKAFKNFAKILGLDTGADLENIYPIIKESDAIIEIGAGYGRCIEQLLERGYQGKIIAIEQASRLVGLLYKRFGDKIQLIHADALKIQEELPKVQAVICLWSGFLEFSPEEQKRLIQLAYEWLSETGEFVIEIPYQKVYKIGRIGADRKVVVDTEWGVLNAYLPEEAEIRSAATAAGFKSVDSQVYETSNGIQRIFYVLNK
jgi:hypothetical protein